MLHKIFKLISIVSFILFILSIILTVVYHHAFLVGIICFALTSYLFFVFSTWARRLYKQKNYIELIDTKFKDYMSLKKYAEAKKLLDINDKDVRKYYYHNQTISDYFKEFDGYKGYSKSFKVRNEAYLYYYTQTNNFKDGQNFISKLPMTVIKEHLHIKYLFEVLNNDKKKYTNTFAQIMSNERSNDVKERVRIINDLISTNNYYNKIYEPNYLEQQIISKVLNK